MNEVRIQSFNELFREVLDGIEINDGEKRFLTLQIKSYVERELSETKKIYHKYKSNLPLLSVLINSIYFGHPYKEIYFDVRKGMEQVIEHKNIILEGVKITYNNMSQDNVYTLIKQKEESNRFDQLFASYVDKFNKDLTIGAKESKCDVKQMNKTRKKILTLSKKYQK